MADTTEADGWRDRDLIGSDGEKIGTVDEIYEDQGGTPPPLGHADRSI